MSVIDDRVFVDTGAWIALAVAGDPYHERARATWESLRLAAAVIHTSVPVVIETFTFLDRNGGRQLATQWRDQVTGLRAVRIMETGLSDLTKAWPWLGRGELVRLSVVDALSFVLMKRNRLRAAFGYDQHFAQAGFRLLG